MNAADLLFAGPPTPCETCNRCSRCPYRYEHCFADLAGRGATSADREVK